MVLDSVVDLLSGRDNDIDILAKCEAQIFGRPRIERVSLALKVAIVVGIVALVLGRPV